MTPADRAARERKQKIFVAVGGLLLVALLAIQLPKLLGGSSSPSASPATTSTDTTGTRATPGPTSVASRSLVAHLGIDSFARFGSKDPFVQQVKLSEAPSSSDSSGKGSGSDAKDEKKSSSKASTEKFTLGAQPTASMTVISVNGARQALSAGARFPAVDPIFVLVSEDQQKKTVVVGIAGGAYTSGSRTTKLAVGKPLVLVNTTTGARYKLVLVAVGNGQAAAAAKSDAKDSGSGSPSATPSNAPSAP